MNNISKHIILTFFALLTLTACSDDELLSAPDMPGEEGEFVYTLNLGLDTQEFARSDCESTVITNLKNRWCYGDQVKLIETSNASSPAEYIFEIATPAGKQPGDVVDGVVATFTHHATQAIRNYNNFKGRLEYVNSNVNTTEDVPTDNRPLSFGGTGNRFPATVHKYSLQMSNDDPDHLKYIDNFTLDIVGVNLQTRTAPFILKHNISVLKIVLDGFYYPIYGGSLLMIQGFRNSENFQPLALVLGNGQVGEANGGYSIDKTTTPHTIHGTPFVDVSSEKEPFTGYAKNDNNHKLVAYIALKEELHVNAGTKINIMVMDSWADDAYTWQSNPLSARKFPLGQVYTIDMTAKNSSGKPIHEPIGSINLGQPANYMFASSKNLGAERPQDVGDFYSFGINSKIHEGQPYSLRRYMFYDNSEGDALAAYINMGSGELVHKDPFTYELNNTTGKNYYEDVLLYTKTYSHIFTLWNEIYTDLKNMPASFGTWTLAETLSTAWTASATRQPHYEPIGPDGRATSFGSDVAGVFVYNSDTGHGVYLPSASFLEPSDYDPEHNLGKIGEDAIAVASPGDEDYVYLVTQYLFLPCAHSTDDPNKNVQLSTIRFNKTRQEKTKIFKELYQAFPIRPCMRYGIYTYIVTLPTY